MPPTRNGKIASLPVRIREELCLRLHNGDRGPQLLPWLNSLPEVLQILDERFGEEPITPQNLSEWRQGGYQDWLARAEKIERTRVLSAYCRQLTEANPGGSNLPAAIAGGQLLEVLEDFDPDILKPLLAKKPETYIGLVLAVAKLQEGRAKERVADQNDRRLEQNQEKLAQSERALQLAEEKFRRQTAELFLKLRSDERAREIADSDSPQEVKMERLVQLMFGQAPASPAVPALSSTPSSPPLCASAPLREPLPSSSPAP